MNVTLNIFYIKFEYYVAYLISITTRMNYLSLLSPFYALFSSAAAQT
jgi:hypothetical protein